MNIITITLIAALSFYPVGGNQFSFEDRVFEQDYGENWSAAFGVEAKILEHGYVKGRVQILTEFTDTIQMIPTTGAYLIEAGMVFGGLRIYIEHSCSHPTIPCPQSWSSMKTIDAGYTCVGIEVRGEVLKWKIRE